MEHFFKSLVRRYNFGLKNYTLCLRRIEEPMQLSWLDKECVSSLLGQHHCLGTVVANNADFPLDWVKCLSIGGMAMEWSACKR